VAVVTFLLLRWLSVVVAAAAVGDVSHAIEHDQVTAIVGRSGIKTGIVQVFCVVCMPEGDGITALGRIKLDKPDLPVVMLSMQSLPLFLHTWYNGSCEAGNGALRNCTHEAAARQDRIGHCTADDTEAARQMANEHHMIQTDCKINVFWARPWADTKITRLQGWQHE
jgi:hypothetical protein